MKIVNARPLWKFLVSLIVLWTKFWILIVSLPQVCLPLCKNTTKTFGVSHGFLLHYRKKKIILVKIIFPQICVCCYLPHYSGLKRSLWKLKLDWLIHNSPILSSPLMPWSPSIKEGTVFAIWNLSVFHGFSKIVADVSEIVLKQLALCDFVPPF